MAEQLTVDLVMDKDHFAVMDRANLKSILAEHKLTATGLIDPENAKQLGKFSGVDALIIGNIASIGSSISVVVKVITTETAEVVAAGKTKFNSDDTMQQLLAQTIPTDNRGNEQSGTLPPAMSQQFSNLLVAVEHVAVMGGQVTLELSFKNTSRKSSIAIALYSKSPYNMRINMASSSLVAADGTELQTEDINIHGIGVTRLNPEDFADDGRANQRELSSRYSETRPRSLDPPLPF